MKMLDDGACNRSATWRTRSSGIKGTVGRKKNFLLDPALWDLFLCCITNYHCQLTNDNTQCRHMIETWKFNEVTTGYGGVTAACWKFYVISWPCLLQTRWELVGGYLVQKCVCAKKGDQKCLDPRNQDPRTISWFWLCILGRRPSFQDPPTCTNGGTIG